jgi:hypothetical protein
MKNLPSTLKIIVVTVLLAPIPDCIADSDSKLTCPEQISEPSIMLKDVGAGWRPYVASPLYLHSVAPTDGPPEHLGQLMGKQVKAGSDSWTDLYDLRGRFPDGKWLQCSYGMLNEIVLSKRLDDRITSCTVMGRKGEKAGQNVFSVVCR